jgi:hypothetical protein
MTSQGITGHGYYAVIGSVLVLLSVIGMAASHWIEEKMTCTKPNPESGLLPNPDKDVDENSIALMGDKK